MSLALRVTMPEAISSDASLSSAARALDGAEDTTVDIWRLTRMLRSSLEKEGMSGTEYKNRQDQALNYMGILSGSPLKRGSTCTCNAPHGSLLFVAAMLACAVPVDGRDRELEEAF
jgi:hypothetical protein